MSAEVVLVNMPWAEYLRPSMQLGLIQALLEEKGLKVRSVYANVSFAGRCGLESYRKTEDYDRAACEWVFHAAAFGEDEESAFLAHLRRRGAPDAEIRELRRLRRLVPEFIDATMTTIRRHAPSVVGFTTAMLQSVASLALARRIKEEQPTTKIVFGGSPCEGDMGPAMVEAFPVVDVVVREECDPWVADLFRRLIEGRRLDDLPGIVWRDRDETVHVNPSATRFDALDENPHPNFNDYFEQLQELGLAGAFETSIPFEGSRGCWWGEIRHCTFCGLNGPTMAYRTRSADSVVNELAAQRKRFGVSTFVAVDEIIPQHFFADLPPLLKERLPGAVLFYEMTPATTRERLAGIAGSVRLFTQPGIESLVTTVLRSMGKATRGIDNVVFLRRAAELDVGVLWNFLFGLPGEALEQYERVVEQFPTLHHLVPPNLLPLSLERFSPYFDRPYEYGIRITGPREAYRYVYAVEEDLLWRLASCFDYDYVDGYDPRPAGALLQSAIGRWRRDSETAVLRAIADGPSIRIEDTRGGSYRRHSLDAKESLMYRMLESPRKAVDLSRSLLSRFPSEYVRLGGANGVSGLLEALTSARLLWNEGDHFVAVAVPDQPDFWLPSAVKTPHQAARSIA